MQLAFLSPLFERPGPWASVYFHSAFVSEDAAARQELNARGISDRLHEQGADAATCRAVHDKLSRLSRSGEPSGAAVFAADGEVVLETALTAPPAGGAIVSWQALPHISPIPQLAAEEPTCLVAYVDRTGADLELRDLRGAHSAGTVRGEDWPVHRSPSGDWSEGHFQKSVENTWEHNADAIADALRDSREETGAELVVLSGDRRECRAVHDRLRPELRERTIEAEHGPRVPEGDKDGATGQHLLDKEIEQARATRRQRQVADAMERFRAGRVPSDAGEQSAAEGVPALIEAAREHRVATLLLRPDGADPHREVWVGEEPDQLAVRSAETQYLGEPKPSRARADDALLRSVATTGAEVLRVDSTDLPDDAPEDLPAGGLGALLRWPYSRAEQGDESGG